ncbi:MAG TPA: Na+/H+ antiporter NhaA [Alphaproteobacteria bacterium]|nr:Na+/H+ antiporter NhaA [Alphaproteobacteria bacterium]
MPLRLMREFFRLEAAGGLVLIAASFLAVVLANSPAAGFYDRLLGLTLTMALGEAGLSKPLVLWINDGLMAVFFFLVGLEIKRELLEGQLAGRQQAMLPALAALGGMIVPAAVFVAINAGVPGNLNGWAIPAATDIAFALGILALLGSRAPLSLKVLLTAIAIIDDLGAIVIIALFYTADLSVGALAFAALAIVVLVALNRLGVTRTTPYVLTGIVLWTLVLKSGVHATLAGVVVALAIPLAPKDAEGNSPLGRLEHGLHPWVAFGVLPVFGFANAGVSFAGMTPASLMEPLTLGIALGLLVGKQIGVFGAVWLSVRAGLARMPEGVNWLQVYGVAVLCGIGFTMSLFIGGLAFADTATAGPIRLGVLSGSIVSAVLGYALLRFAPAADRRPVPA